MKAVRAIKRKWTGRRVGLKGVIQRDNVSCGFCAASTVYRFYGLSPRTCRLRECLGPDRLPFMVPFREKVEAWLRSCCDFEGLGTQPWDMLAALYWDGFDTETLTGSFADCRNRLLMHFGQGHPAIALIDGLSLWVAISGAD